MNFSWWRIPEMRHFLQITIARKTRQFLPIENSRIRPLSANYDCKKNIKISQEKLCNFSWSRNAEMGQFLQITIARKTLPFLNKNYTISSDHKMQKCATFFKLRSQQKLYHFSRKTIQFLVIAKWRNGPLSPNYDRKKNHTISPDRKLQNRTTFCKLRSQEKLDHFSRKTTQFLVITNCKNGPFSANYDHKKSQTIFQEKPYNFSWSQIAEYGHFL